MMSSFGSLLAAASRFLTTTRMALALAFGLLLTLLVLSGLNAVHVISQLQASNENILSEFLRRETQLDRLRSAIYLSGTYVRDYLLEPDANQAEQSRLALAETRQEIQSLMSVIHTPADTRGREMRADLEQEIREYWRTLDPVLTWSVQHRHQEGYRFLHDQVLPRRSSTLGITDTIASVNQQQLVERDHRLVQMFAGLRNRLLIAVAAMFLCGLALASLTAIHILRLQARTIAHLQAVTDARQELRNLSARLVETQENERKNISRELHDAVGQSMSAVQFELHDLAVALTAYPEPLRTRVDRIRELVESSVAIVRNMALLLRPSMLDDLGLAAAVEWQARRIAKSAGVRIETALEQLPDQLSEEHKICIFRVVQEALNNVCRHARASAVEITALARGDEIVVTIRDDGRGFRVPRQNGLGLIGMQERAESLGGRLAVHSEPGKGAAIEISLPVAQRVAGGSPLPGSASQTHPPIRLEPLCRNE